MFDFLFFFNSALLGVGLAMDAFSVSLANGLGEPCMKKRKMVGIAGVFAFFQAMMPLIGWFLVHNAAKMFSEFEKFIPWIALLLLGYIGGKMLFDGVIELKNPTEDDCECRKKLGITTLIVQGIATSIDALSVGFTIANYDTMMALVTAFIIALVTFVICYFGIILGKTFGTALKGKSAIFGGVILIVIGIEIFVTSLV
ncbi:MAG: manganese efflux pump [Clostridia bacterium]|nr:manganese efflux pump [Clostridia bacterium]